MIDDNSWVSTDPESYVAAQDAHVQKKKKPMTVSEAKQQNDEAERASVSGVKNYGDETKGLNPS